MNTEKQLKFGWLNDSVKIYTNDRLDEMAEQQRQAIISPKEKPQRNGIER